MDEEEEKPISQNIPKTDGLMTLIDLRLPRWVLKLPAFMIRALVPESDEMKLIFMIVGMLVMFAVWGAWDYSACKTRNNDCGFMECMGHNEPKPKKK